jgi:phospho-N-acetylmuramoyl-pentapeptide-transferase
MLYYLFSYLNKNYSIPGAGVFQYITFRMAMAVIVSLLSYHSIRSQTD